MAEVLIFILALPMLFLAVGWFVLCAPMMMLIAVPVWGSLTLIDQLRGKQTHFWAMIWDVFTMGFQMYQQTTGLF